MRPEKLVTPADDDPALIQDAQDGPRPPLHGLEILAACRKPGKDTKLYENEATIGAIGA